MWDFVVGKDDYNISLLGQEYLPPEINFLSFNWTYGYSGSHTGAMGIGTSSTPVFDSAGDFYMLVYRRTGTCTLPKDLQDDQGRCSVADFLARDPYIKVSVTRYCGSTGSEYFKTFAINRYSNIAYAYLMYQIDESTWIDDVLMGKIDGHTKMIGNNTSSSSDNILHMAEYLGLSTYNLIDSEATKEPFKYIIDTQQTETPSE
jgi:hypothetical protein